MMERRDGRVTGVLRVPAMENVNGGWNGEWGMARAMQAGVGLPQPSVQWTGGGDTLEIPDGECHAPVNQSSHSIPRHPATRQATGPPGLGATLGDWTESRATHVTGLSGSGLAAPGPVSSVSALFSSGHYGALPPAVLRFDNSLSRSSSPLEQWKSTMILYGEVTIAAATDKPKASSRVPSTDSRGRCGRATAPAKLQCSPRDDPMLREAVSLGWTRTDETVKRATSAATRTLSFRRRSPRNSQEGGEDGREEQHHHQSTFSPDSIGPRRTRSSQEQTSSNTYACQEFPHLSPACLPRLWD